MFFFKKILTLGLIAAAAYMLLGYHYIVIDNSIGMLKKTELTLKYTIVSTKGKSIESVLKIPPLWDAGIGELMVEREKMDWKELELYAIKMGKDYY